MDQSNARGFCRPQGGAVSQVFWTPTVGQGGPKLASPVRPSKQNRLTELSNPARGQTVISRLPSLAPSKTGVAIGTTACDVLGCDQARIPRPCQRCLLVERRRHSVVHLLRAQVVKSPERLYSCRPVDVDAPSRRAGPTHVGLKDLTNVSYAMETPAGSNRSPLAAIRKEKRHVFHRYNLGN